MFSVVLNNARICWSFFYPPLSSVRSNLCNIWRYPLWSATYVIYGGIYSGNLWPAQQATCLKSKQQIVHKSFFLKYQLLYIRSALFCVSVNLIQHASCNFPIFFFIRHHTQSFIKSIFIHIYSKCEIYKRINYSLLHHHTQCFNKIINH